jgi:hypothetical protein
MGDLHGDLTAARRALRLAGAIDASDGWVGGKLVVVQVGDQIDRGDDDRAMIDLFDGLKRDAAKAGGEVIALVGNHEVMNAQLDFRYVTPGAFAKFADVTPTDERAASAALAADPKERGRVLAFRPGGPYAKKLAERPAVAQLGDTVFVHGGVLPKYARMGIAKINDSVRAFLRGDVSTPAKELTAEDGPLWARNYSAATGKDDCAVLDEALAVLDAKRMVMGHTPQNPDISPACNEHAWRIDVGMSKAYGGRIEVLEIRGDAFTILKE